MPQYKGSGVLGKKRGNRGQRPLAPQQVTMSKKNRQRGFGDTVKPVTESQDNSILVYGPHPTKASPERDALILASYRREMRLCDERACLCQCHCHAGPSDCYLEEPSGFHLRQPNESHKRAHRECPKGDHHKW